MNEMSSCRCDNWNLQLTVYMLAVLFCIFPFHLCGFSALPLDVEKWILFSLVGVFSALHFHYGYGVVTEMCQHFGIKCFTVSVISRVLSLTKYNFFVSPQIKPKDEAKNGEIVMNA